MKLKHYITRHYYLPQVQDKLSQLDSKIEKANKKYI